MQRWRDNEPGLLQIFRFYAWLRLPVAAMLIFVLLSPPSVAEHHPPIQAASPLVVGLVVTYNLLVLGALYWPWLERKLGAWYFPSLLAFAALSLVLEQRLIFSQRIAWEISPFLYILLILAAWQFGWRGVLTFTLSLAGLDVIINQLAPNPMMLVGPEGVPPRDIFIYTGIISRSVTFLVIGYVVSQLVKAQREQRRQLAEANQRLVSHAATLEQLATTRERVRLSRDLHDTLAHTLSAQAVQLDAVLTVWKDIPERAQQMLERMLAATRSGLDETRRALRDLRAAPLEETGLAQALQALAEDLAQRHSLSLELDLPESADDLPPEVEQCFYRVGQEALENTARHASARRLILSLAATPTRATLHVEDDGQGFDLQAATNGLGVQGMRERAELIGAHLEIQSRPGAGTQVDLSWEAGA